MTTRTLLRSFALVITLGLGLTNATTNGAFVGSFGINGNIPSVAPTTGLAGATSFTIGSMSSNGNSTGGFSGLAVGTIFSGSTFTLGVATGFTFSNATVGTFTQTVAPVVLSMGVANGVVISESFNILGTYVGGPVGTMATPASFTVSFTQTGGPGTSISSSGTVNIPPLGVAVPEPASVVMMGIGLLTAGGFGLRRRLAMAA